MRTLFTALTALMLFATPVVAGAAEEECKDGLAAYGTGDYQKAYRLFYPLAYLGVANAQVMLGYMYRKGQGVPKDDAKAVQWYRDAAKRGHTLAQYAHGVMYNNGYGIPKDDAKAFYWYRRAA